MLPGAHQVAIVSGRRAQLQLWIERCARPHNGRNQDTARPPRCCRSSRRYDRPPPTERYDRGQLHRDRGLRLLPELLQRPVGAPRREPGRLSHLFRDFEDCAETYRDATWPERAQRAPRGIIQTRHVTAGQELSAVAPMRSSRWHMSSGHVVLADLAIGRSYLQQIIRITRVRVRSRAEAMVGAVPNIVPGRYNPHRSAG
jgi:hypothetical protein